MPSGSKRSPTKATSWCWATRRASSRTTRSTPPSRWQPGNTRATPQARRAHAVRPVCPAGPGCDQAPVQRLEARRRGVPPGRCPRTGPAAAGPSSARAAGSQGQRPQPLGRPGHVARWEEGGGTDRAQGLEVPAAGRGHHRQPDGHGLDHGQAERLVRGRGQQDRAAAHPGRQVGLVAHEVDRVAGLRACRPAGAASAACEPSPATTRRQPSAGQPRSGPGRQGHVGGLLGLEPLGHQDHRPGRRSGRGPRRARGCPVGMTWARPGAPVGHVGADRHLGGQAEAQGPVGQPGGGRVPPAAGEVQGRHHRAAQRRRRRPRAARSAAVMWACSRSGSGSAGPRPGPPPPPWAPA